MTILLNCSQKPVWNPSNRMPPRPSQRTWLTALLARPRGGGYPGKLIPPLFCLFFFFSFKSFLFLRLVLRGQEQSHILINRQKHDVSKISNWHKKWLYSKSAAGQSPRLSLHNQQYFPISGRLHNVSLRKEVDLTEQIEKLHQRKTLTHKLQSASAPLRHGASASEAKGHLAPLDAAQKGVWQNIGSPSQPVMRRSCVRQARLSQFDPCELNKGVFYCLRV